jgi:hypothetical protein
MDLRSVIGKDLLKMAGSTQLRGAVQRMSFQKEPGFAQLHPSPRVDAATRCGNRVIHHRRSAFQKKRVITEGKTSEISLVFDEQSADERICAGLIISFWSLSTCSRDEIFWQRRLSEPQ